MKRWKGYILFYQFILLILKCNKSPAVDSFLFAKLILTASQNYLQVLLALEIAF